MTPSEQRYRVWVEKFESGWIEVTAPDEEIARDRAQTVADAARWYPESSHSNPLTVELLPAATKGGKA